MKNKLIISILFIKALCLSCEEEYVEPNNFSDAGWYTSIFETAHTDYKIGVNDFISFSNLSQNTVDHSWTISGGNFFLKGPITRQDTLLDKFIVNPGDSVSLEKTVHVLFKTGGIHTVRLYNTFMDSVAYRGLDTIPAKKVGDMWVMDHTFIVDVYDAILPEVGIKQHDLDIPIGNDTIYVEAGDELTFLDLSTIGRPNARSWRVDGIEESTDSVATLLFKRLGVFQVVLISSRTGENIPGGRARWEIPNPIKVIPSSKPFIQSGDIVELEDETIQVPYNGEFSPFFGQEQFFTVKVNDIEFDISSVTLDPGDATLLNIKLVDKIYRPDVIEVSYAGGILGSTDERLAEPFTDVIVVMHDVNLLSDEVYGFENGPGAGWEARQNNNADFEITSNKAASGDYSLMIHKKDGQVNAGVESINDKFNLEAGKTYIYSYKVWVDPSSIGPARSDTWLAEQVHHFWVNPNTIPKNTWHTVTFEYTAGADIETHIYIRVLDNGIYYFDDFYLVEKEERP